MFLAVSPHAAPPRTRQRRPAARAGRRCAWLWILVAAAALPGRAGSSGPPVMRAALANGIRLLVSEQRAVPMVIVDVAIEAGSRLDPPGKEGLANLTADLLTEGTSKRSAREIRETVDFLGASLSSAGGVDYSSVRLTVLRKDLETGLDLLADVLRHPSFPAQEVERRRDAILAGMKADEDNPGAVASKAFLRALFAGEPYGHPAEGWPESVRKLRRADVRDFYRQWYVPARAIVTVVGDVDAQEAQLSVERYLGAWEGLAPPAPSYPQVAEPPAATVVIDKPVSQANIVLGHRGVERSNPDFYGLSVMNYILGGGGFSSRLLNSIRTEAGLAYSVASFFTVNRDPGSFQVVMQTKNATARAAIERARAEIERIRNELVSEEEIAEARQYLTGSFPLRLDTNAEIAGFLSQVEFYGLGEDYADQYARRIQAVTREEVRRVAQKYLHPDRLVLVVVGNSAETGIRP